MMMAPLFVKYRDRDGQRYVYDIRSAEILRVGLVVYEVLDDYHVLTQSEIIVKYNSFSEKELSHVLEQLDDLQSKNVLSDHAPALTYTPERIICGKESEPILDFLNHRRRLLTLEVTHRCNLACEYCCYGKHYSRNRHDSQNTMPLDTAKKAVRQFIAHRPKDIYISFYGGEPLLEFDLIKEVVFFSEALARDDGKDVKFSMTTNGTLLTDEIIHFLVEHRFSVVVSLDGGKETHDRYRIFKSKGPRGERHGSYDVVVKNMKRFVELYPDYGGRGLTVTLTATSDIDEVDNVVGQWKAHFPVATVNTVLDVRPNSKAANDERRGVGCSLFPPCDDSFCGRRFDVEGDNGSSGDRSRPAIRPEGECTAGPEFDRWSNEVRQRYRASRHDYCVKIGQAADKDEAASTANASVVHRNNALASLRDLHSRTLQGRGSKSFPAAVRLACLPGATRTYCSTSGTFFACERTECGKPFIVGNVENDVNPDEAYRLAEILRLHCDCGNCILNRLCAFCPAQLRESTDQPGMVDSSEVRRVCNEMSSTADFAARLKEYSEVMVANPRVLDWLDPGAPSPDDDWLNGVRIRPKTPNKIELSVEELADWA